MRPILKLVLEIGPLVVFFLANSRYGIFTGTMIFMAATVLAFAASYAIMRKIPVMPLVSGVFVLVLGGLTVVLADDLFIKLKPTIVNVCFAGILFFGLKTNRLYAKLVFEAAFNLTDRGWVLITQAWIWFFLFLATLNEIVWRTTSTDMWVKFKVFGVMPMTVMFSIALLPTIMKHSLPAAAPTGDSGTGEN
ncbi:MAG: septation protein A [Rhodospirillaceae bacterium]|nr:MAG: septation protein A [Rhodospirillaceae bacterium]